MKSSISPIYTVYTVYSLIMYVCIKAYNNIYRLVGSNDAASPTIKLVFASTLANKKLTLAIFQHTTLLMNAAQARVPKCLSTVLCQPVHK